jgi:Mn-dependent DtxR family transcriptional regulator
MSKLPIPPDALSQHVIVLGKTRSGKSSKVRVLVEWLLANKKRVVILTPKDDWWGLKASADGKQEGYPIVIFGGKHEDLPFNPRAGAQVAELIATGNRPCLITFARQKPSDRTRFYNDFMEGLFKFHQGELYVVIDEVHNFAPKGKVFSPDAGMMIHWSNTLASEGQGQGLIMIAASQRPQKVHNDLLTSCETLIACRVIHKADRDANKDWIDGCADPQVGRDLLADLASMDRSDAWCWSPEIGFGPKRISWPMFETFDSFKPQTGAAPAKLKGWADVDLDEVKSKLQAVVKEAEANDPAALKKQIAELQRQIKATPAAAVAQPIDGAEYYRSGYNDGRDRGWKDCADLARPYLTGLVDHNESFLDKVEHIVKLVTSTPKFHGAAPTKVPHSAAPKTGLNGLKQVKTSPTKVPHNGEAGLDISRPQQKILDQLAWLESMDIYPAPKETLAAVCRVSPSSSSYANNLGALRTAGLLDKGGGGFVSFTDSGRAAASAPPETGQPVHEHWFEIVSKPQRLILETLVKHHAEPIAKDMLAEEIGVSSSSSSFANNLGALRTLGAIDYPSAGMVHLTRYVMP